jgi:methylenetetrahydrofolate reductase (NADPH)
MEMADKAGNAQEEGVQIVLELIHQVKKYHGQGVSGIHLMPVGWDEIVPRIIREADLLPFGKPVAQQIQPSLAKSLP